MRVVIEPSHVRAAMQSAAGQGLKSTALEGYVAAYLSRITYTEKMTYVEPNRVPSPRPTDAE